MAERDLKELEDVLWAHFDYARKEHSKYTDPQASNETKTSYGSPGNFAIENRKALGELGQAIAAVRRERRIEKLLESQQRIEEEMDAGLKSGVTPLSPIKLKSP